MRNDLTQKYYAIRHKDSGKLVSIGFLHRGEVYRQYKASKKKVPYMDHTHMLWSLLNPHSEFSVKYGYLTGKNKLDLVNQLEQLNSRMKFTFNESTQKYKEELFVFDDRFEIVKVTVKLTNTIEVV